MITLEFKIQNKKLISIFGTGEAAAQGRSKYALSRDKPEDGVAEASS